MYSLVKVSAAHNHLADEDGVKTLKLKADDLRREASKRAPTTSKMRERFDDVCAM